MVLSFHAATIEAGLEEGLALCSEKSFVELLRLPTGYKIKGR